MRNRLLWSILFLLFLAACKEKGKAVVNQKAGVDLSTVHKNPNELLDLAASYVNRPGEKNEDLDSAKQLVRQAQVQNDALQTDTIQAKIYLVYSTAFREAGDTATGHQHINHCLSILKGHAPSAILGDAYQELANYYNVETDEGVAARKALYEKAIEQFQLSNSKEKLAYALKYTADLEQWNGNYGKSLSLLNQSMAVYKEINYKNLQTVYDLMGMVYTRLGDFPNAVKYGLLAVQNAEANGDTSLGLATIYNRLATSYAQSHQPKEAIVYGKKALNVALKYEAADAVFDILIIVTYPMIDEGDWQGAIREADEVQRSIGPGDLADTVNLYGVYGSAYINGRKFANAGKYVQQLEQIIRKHVNDEMSRELIHAYRCVILYYTAVQDYKKLRHYAQGAVENASKFNLLPPLRRAYQYLATSDSALGNFHDAYLHYQKYAYLSDSIYTQNKSIQFAQLQVAYETDKKNQEIALKQKDIALLKNQSTLQQLGLKQAQTTRNIIIATALSLLALLAFGYFIQRRHSIQLKKKQVEIDTQNSQLKGMVSEQNKLLKEKEWLVKEIHHRVKNNLQIVVSLFNAQSDFTNNPTALKAIQEGRERMQAIALLHQKLYGPERGGKTNMASYIPELVNMLEAGATRPEHLRFEMDVDDIALDVSQAVPAGLILNEAVTNAIKYAYQNHAGIIRILFKKIGEQELLLQVVDEGAGFPPDVLSGQTNSLGLQLIKLFAEQLDGKLELLNNNGAKVSVLFLRQQFDEAIPISNTYPENGKNSHS